LALESHLLIRLLQLQCSDQPIFSTTHMCALNSPTRFISASTLIALLGAFGIPTQAQTNVVSDNFDSYSLGAFGSTYNDASGGNVTATIVAPGAGGAGQALQLSGNITNGVSENAGVNFPVYTPGNNTDTNLSDYTLSFDLAITHGTNTGFGVTLNIFGTGAADGSSYAVPINQITVGGAFQHFSANMGALPAGYEIPVLNPTDGHYSFQLVFLGFDASVTATPETIALDNLLITTAVTNSNPGPYTNAGTASINPQITYQTIEGLGGAVAFYDGWVPAHPYKLEIYTNAFAGLNLSMLRLGDWYRYNADFNLAGGDGQVAGDIVSNANRILGHPAPVYLSSWSPPAFLKSNGQTGNGGTLITTNGGFDYADFAQYWYDSLQAYGSNGVSPAWISIQNEPDWTAGYDSCLFDPTETTNASYGKALDATFQRLTNLPSPPRLLAPECVGIGYNDVQNYAAAMNSNSFYGLAHHLYGGSTDGTPDGYTANLSALTNVFPGKPHFMTEFGYPDMINTACLIHDCLTVGQDAGFDYWSLIWPFPGDALVQMENPYASQSTWTNAPPGVTTDSHGWWLTPAYWAMKHFSYFIQPGYRRVSASASDGNVRSSAFLSPDGSRLVVVLINTNAAASSAMTLNFGAFNAGKSSVYQTAGTNTYAGTNTFLSLGSLTNPQTLPPLSLTTVVLDQVVRPVIVTATTGTSLTMSWPVASAGFTLQSCTNLASTNWAAVSSPLPQIAGTNYQVTVPATNTPQFFRLSQ
jgi:O-glycosyl hydrolase